MSIAGVVRGPARIELLRNHRLAVFTRVFGHYIEGRAASVDDIQVRAEKLKLLRRKRRRYLPQRGDNGF